MMIPVKPGSVMTGLDHSLFISYLFVLLRLCSKWNIRVSKGRES